MERKARNIKYTFILLNFSLVINLLSINSLLVSPSTFSIFPTHSPFTDVPGWTGWTHDWQTWPGPWLGHISGDCDDAGWARGLASWHMTLACWWSRRGNYIQRNGHSCVSSEDWYRAMIGVISKCVACSHQANICNESHQHVIIVSLSNARDLNASSKGRKAEEL